MKTKTLLQIASAIIGSFNNTACTTNSQHDLSQLPLVNSIASIKDRTATAIPLSDEKLFMVTGRVSHSVYILGEGVIILEDLNNAEHKLYLVAKDKHTKGKVITVTIKRKEILSVDSENFAMYIEK